MQWDDSVWLYLCGHTRAGRWVRVVAVVVALAAWWLLHVRTISAVSPSGRFCARIRYYVWGPSSLLELTDRATRSTTVLYGELMWFPDPTAPERNRMVVWDRDEAGFVFVCEQFVGETRWERLSAGFAVDATTGHAEEVDVSGTPWAMQIIDGMPPVRPSQDVPSRHDRER